MPYSAQIVLASVSRRAFLFSFLAWWMIFAVWFNCCSSVDMFVYVLFYGFKNGLLSVGSSCIVFVLNTLTVRCSET